MKSALTWILALSITAIAGAQGRKQIDSLNGIPFSVKTEKASILDAAFLNASYARRLGYKLGEAMSYSNLSIIFYYQGKYNLNVDYALKAIALFEELKDFNKLGNEYGLLGYSMKRRNMPKALYYMQKGKAIAESNRDTTSLLSIYNNYGVLKEMQCELDSALYFYKKGLVIKQVVNDSLGIPFSLNNIAGVYLLKKEYKEAEKRYDIALAMRRQQNDGIGLAENYTYFGDLHLAQKNYTKALSFYQQALHEAQKYNYIDLIRNSYHFISRCYELLGKYRAAFENYTNYTLYKDSLVNSETNSKIAELEVRFETNNKEKLLIKNQNLLLQKEAEVRNRNNLLIMLSLLSLFIAITGFLVYRQQKLRNRQQVQEHDPKSAIAHIETQNKLHQQRLSISRDLHDNIGAQLTFIISSVDNIKYAFDVRDTKLDTKLQRISNFAKDTILELRDTIWAMNTDAITIENLMSRILNFIEKARSATDNITFSIQIEPGIQQLQLTSVVGMNIYRTVQEAVNNAIKHSEATMVAINATSDDHNIIVTVAEDGKGFEPNTVEKGNGLANMQKRMTEINGKVEILSRSGSGAEVRLVLIKQELK